MGILSGKRQFHLTISLFVIMNLSEWWFSTCHWFKIRTIRKQDIYLLRENKWNEIKNQCTFYELTWCWEYRNDRVFVCNISLWFAMLIALCINFESLIYTKQNWIRRMPGEFWSVQLTTFCYMNKWKLCVKCTAKSDLHVKVYKCTWKRYCIYNELLLYVKCTARCVLLMCE